MRGAIDAARKSYDLIIVDLPPLGHPEAKSLFRSLDGVLIVDRVADPSTLATWEEYEAHHRDAFVERMTAFVERVGS